MVERVAQHLTNNLNLLVIFALILVAGYGFELFNLNLTIDEEIHAFQHAAPQWAAQGRWGMYLLNEYLISQPVVPFVTLFVGLTFHLLAIILLLNCWEVNTTSKGVLVGSVGIAYPGMAYMYTFSTISYGIGLGLFFVALSLYVFVKANGAKKYYAALPAAAALAIYQGFAVALAVAFLVQIIFSHTKPEKRNLDVRQFLTIGAVGIGSLAIYLAIQKLFLVLLGSNISYVDAFFDLNHLLENFGDTTKSVLRKTVKILGGSGSVYGADIRALAVLSIIAASGTTMRIVRSELSVSAKIIIGSLAFVLLLIPFISGFFMKGYLSMRFLVSLPILFSGLVLLGLDGKSSMARLVYGTLVCVCIFQFVLSTNTLFSSSAMALEADRALATQILTRIPNVITQETADQVKYLEVIGQPNREQSRLTKKRETFGASFFEWDQGNAGRVVYFLRLLGYSDLEQSPLERSGELMQHTQSMPEWPNKGSLHVFGDTLVLKFSPYSTRQIASICSSYEKSVGCSED